MFEVRNRMINIALGIHIGKLLLVFSLPFSGENSGLHKRYIESFILNRTRTASGCDYYIRRMLGWWKYHGNYSPPPINLTNQWVFHIRTCCALENAHVTSLKRDRGRSVQPLFIIGHPSIYYSCLQAKNRFLCLGKLFILYIVVRLH